MNIILQSELETLYSTKLVTEDPKKMTYAQLSARHSKLYNALPVMFCFGQDQYDKMIKKHNISKDNKITSIGHGGYILSKDKTLYLDTISKMNTETECAMNNPKYLYDMFYYELGNHEFQITCDLEPTLDACGLTRGELTPMQGEALRQAQSNFINDCDINDWY